MRGSGHGPASRSGPVPPPAAPGGTNRPPHAGDAPAPRRPAPDRTTATGTIGTGTTGTGTSANRTAADSTTAHRTAADRGTRTSAAIGPGSATRRGTSASRPSRADTRRRSRRAGVGWWQTPDPRRSSPTFVADAEPDAARTGLVGPLRLLRRTFGPGSSAHRRPLTPAQRTARRRRRVRWGLLGGVAAVVALPLLLLGIGWLVFSVPTADDAVNNQVATISYSDGSDLTRLVPEAGNRTKVTTDQIPVHVREAVLAAEDRTFYSNPGFDLSGIARAAWNQLRGGAGGGSTITQQYVKNALVGDQVSLWRKYKELIVALKVNQEKSKDEILTDYLNTIYFGRGAYGIESAAQAYFGTDVGRLTPAQGALLAGVIQSPSRWDPALDPQKAVQRWDFVMDGMVGQGWLSPAERAAATFPPTQQRRTGTSSGTLTDSRGHVVNAVKAELDSLGITDQEMAQDGLRISTTIDPAEQQQAVAAAQKALSGEPDELRSAVVAVDPRTGGIRAYYGGDNGVGLDYARVSKQPGSTFKPFVVLAALSHDPPIGLGTEFDGTEETGLRNAEGADCPRCDVKQAMTLSNNVVFTKLAARVGPDAVAAAARAAGITAPLDDPDARLALGNKEVTPVDLASAYATIAGGGVWHAPHLISEVVTADGRILYRAPDDGGERRFSAQVARNTVEAMSGVVPADGLTIGRPVVGKTGTVQSRFEGENNDAWFAGFTPDLSTTVWIGTDMNSPIRTSAGTPIEGATLPGEVWQTFMKQATADEPATSGFGGYTPIGTPASDLPPDTTPSTVSEAPSPTRAPTARPEASTEPPPPAGTPPPQGTGPPEQAPPAAADDPPERALLAPDQRRAPADGTAPGQQPRQDPAAPPVQDCSVRPCG